VSEDAADWRMRLDVDSNAISCISGLFILKVSDAPDGYCVRLL
jgi:hypothetical protein